MFHLQRHDNELFKNGQQKKTNISAQKNERKNAIMEATFLHLLAIEML